MYIPTIYKNEDPIAINAFLQKNSFGILVNQVDEKPWATHIPLELDTNENGKQILFGHLSKENPQWKSFTFDSDVLAIFTGPHSYISSSWYDHENVPTWNYTAVHVYGSIKIIEGEAILKSIKKLVDKYESKSEKPVKIEELSPETMQQINGIIAFEIEIKEIHAVHKLSQNRDDKNYQNIIAELEKTGESNSVAVAKEMSKCRK